MRKMSCSSNFLYLILAALLIATIFSFTGQFSSQPEVVSLSQVVNETNQDQVEKIVVEENKLTVDLRDGGQQIAYKEPATSLTEYGIDPQEVKVDVKDTAKYDIWISILGGLLPVLLIGGFLWFMLRGASQGANQAFSFGQSTAKRVQGKDVDTDFDDVAGLEQPKHELMEVVEFLKNPKKFIKLGAEIPKGVLLMGSAGTGKTLMARAVAGEAGVPFYSLSGSEFVEMFVGVGASRTRDLFKKAKENSPAIIFIDELDAVGRRRGTGLGGGHDEREQTLNQILAEMDGFEPNDAVVVIAATNRPDVLDPALLRPGRFDRRVVVDMPDKEERAAILEVHSRNKPLTKDVDLVEISKVTVGFSGADLRNLMNEAAIKAARDNKSKINQKDIIDSIEKVMIGPERKSHLLDEEEKKIAAYHEVGHALVAHLLPNADPVHKISLVARGQALGHTWNLPEKDQKLDARSEFLDKIASIMGGRAAEEIVFNEVTTGAEGDIRQATELARKMVRQYGMSDELGPIAYGEKEEHAFLGKELAEHKGYSDEVAAKIDQAIKHIVEDAKKKARKILKENKELLDRVTNKLIEKETLTGKEFEKIVGAKKVTA
jgi:cell division protease FtsH